jgi:uncharacterized protein YqeY
MTLKERINEDLKAAMKAGDELRRDTIRSIRAAIIEFDKRGIDHEMTPDEEVALLTTAVKRRKDTIEQLANANRPEIVEREKQELAIVQEYLPKQMDESEVAAIVEKIVRESGAVSAADFGKVMGTAMKELKGKADGALVQRLVKEKLGGA